MYVIEAKEIYARYLKGASAYSSLKEFLFNISKKEKAETKYFMALNNINFQLKKGDILGVIGTNGAGKSTLLKLITGVLKAYKGDLIVNGKVTALLELATGFDPDLSVKENIFLRAALLGFNKEFINKRYKTIIEFAELEAHQENLFRNLSSGMQSRLGFAVSSLIEPEILILDEVLAVGDGAFREKSKNKIKEIINNGSTCIIVSHSISDIKSMCNKVLWLNKGQQVIYTDKVIDCCNSYEEFLRSKTLPTSEKDIITLSHNYKKRIESAKLLEEEKEINKIKSMLNKLPASKREKILSMYK